MANPQSTRRRKRLRDFRSLELDDDKCAFQMFERPNFGAGDLPRYVSKDLEMIEVVDICKNVLTRLHAMDYEINGGNSSEQLIFPNKIQAKGNIKRISEQELRLLFIGEFKKTHHEQFYSIETPTKEKYKFGKSYDDIKISKTGQSALIDMCVFKREGKNYQRLLNIEFKHKNSATKDIAKDILKLICEEQNGAFINLLNNTNKGTLCNNKQTGVLDKLYKSFDDFKKNWNNENKCIRILILSLKEQVLIYRDICNSDLCNLKNIFFRPNGCGNIQEINEKEDWKTWRNT